MKNKFLLLIMLLSLILFANGCETKEKVESEQEKEDRIESFANEMYTLAVGDEWLAAIKECGLDDLTASYKFSLAVDYDDNPNTYKVHAELKSFESDKIKDYSDEKLFDLFMIILEKYHLFDEIQYEFETEKGEIITVENYVHDRSKFVIKDSEKNEYMYKNYAGYKGVYINEDLAFGEDSIEILEDVRKEERKEESEKRYCAFCGTQTNSFCTKRKQWECSSCHNSKCK